MCKFSALKITSIALLATTSIAAVAESDAPHCRYQNIGSFALSLDANAPMVDGSINGKPMHLSLNTGSPRTGLTRAAAEKLQLPLQHSNTSYIGFSGESKVYHARIDDFQFGKVDWHHLTLEVPYESTAFTDIDGWFSADFLFDSDVEFDLAKKSVKFFSPDHCDDTHLAYWDENASSIAMDELAPYDKRQYFEVEINDHPIRATISSSTSTTMLNLAAAEKLGFNVHGSNVVPGFKTNGIGKHNGIYWVAQFQSIKIGDETINNPRIRVGDFDANAQLDTNHMLTAESLDDEPQLRLGADFLRAHRVLFAVSQRKMYFSYSRGPVFGPFPELNPEPKQVTQNAAQ